MGRKAKAKPETEPNDANKTEDKKARADKGEERSFVCCLSCYFCDTASLERTDLAAYRAHLAAGHGVTRNVEALLSLIPHLQLGDKLFAQFSYYNYWFMKAQDLFEKKVQFFVAEMIIIF